MHLFRKLSFLLVMVLLIGVLVPGVFAQDDEEPFRVAAVAPSATNDLAFSQSMYDALMLIQEEMGEENFEFVFQDGTFIVDDAAVALREWAASGDFDLIIAHGSQFGSILEELAPDFPDISFAWGTDVNTFGLDNIYAYDAAAEEGGFINGVMAAELTESGVIGVIGPIEVGDAKLYVDGFVEGVAYVDEEIEVIVVYIGSFSDVPLATEQAATLIANGADVLTGSAQMVVGPIALAIDEDVWWFGTQASQAELAEDVGVMFQVYHWEVVLMDIIDSIVEDGVLGGEAYTLTLENEGLVMEVSDAFIEDATEEELDELEMDVEELIDGIIEGDIVIFEEMEEEEASGD